MELEKLSKAQGKLLCVIYRHYLARGITPGAKYMKKACGYSSINSVRCLAEKLVAKGYAKHIPKKTRLKLTKECLAYCKKNYSGKVITAESFKAILIKKDGSLEPELLDNQIKEEMKKPEVKKIIDKMSETEIPENFVGGVPDIAEDLEPLCNCGCVETREENVVGFDEKIQNISAILDHQANKKEERKPTLWQKALNFFLGYRV